MSPRIFIISGPSAHSKREIMRHVLETEYNLEVCISHTTREPREGEIDGVDRHFVSHAVFKKMIERGEFLEYIVYDGELFGTSYEEFRRVQGSGNSDVALLIECEGAAQVRKRESRPMTTIFVSAPASVLEARFRASGNRTENDVRLFLLNERAKYARQGEYLYRVDDDGTPGEAARAIASIIQHVRATSSLKRNRHAFS